MTATNPIRVYQEIKDTYLRYIDTAYWLRSQDLMDERRQMLTDSELLFTDVLLEPVLPYDAAVELRGVVDGIGVDPRAGDLVGEALFGTYTKPGEPHRLRLHQAESLRQSLQPGLADGRNVVVTSGTGSGKTESFLLPVLTRIVDESLGWPAGDPITRWWNDPAKGWQSVRSGSKEGRAAVRALVLYPTNALVEDQITRLRRAIRSISSSGGRQLWFGRYTGSTLGTGELPQSSQDRKRLTEVANDLRDMVAEYDALAGNEKLDLSQFPDPQQGEMLTRWDMVKHPPDVLVTNYSMLNAMLMRDIEEPMFDATRRWLAAAEGNVFNLVVDELHLYRGTAGSEVAMIVRNLLGRLGLGPDSPQLRCLATSASLTDDTSGLEYLEQFFGVGRSSFYVTPGKPRSLDADLPISAADLVRVWNDAAADRRVDEVVERFSLPAAVASACRDKSGQMRATRLERVAENLFDEPSNEALELALDAVSHLSGRPDAIPLRAHMFARTLRGLWACSNPECDQTSRSDNVGIGRLFAIATTVCPCGGRVLELLYCFECGDISLGGLHSASSSFDPGPPSSPNRDACRMSAYAYEMTYRAYRCMPATTRSRAPGPA